MAQKESGRRGGAPSGQKAKSGSRTARLTSVGPHDLRDHQEDPAKPGAKPEEGYGAELARNREAAARQPSGTQPVSPSPKTETTDESGGTEEMLRESDAARDAPHMRGTAKE
jgi:hypothetical protein